jgi:hypothetical protein
MIQKQFLASSSQHFDSCNDISLHLSQIFSFPGGYDGPINSIKSILNVLHRNFRTHIDHYVKTEPHSIPKKYFFLYLLNIHLSKYVTYLLTKSMTLVRKKTIPTERLPLVGEVSANSCG